MIARCTKHGKLPLTEKKSCRKCQQDTVSGKLTKIYTRKELVMMETTISNFRTSFIFQKFRSWRFTFHAYKYLVRITVVNLVELYLNAAHNFKICYVAVIMLRGYLLFFPTKYNHNIIMEMDLFLLRILHWKI